MHNRSQFLCGVHHPVYVQTILQCKETLWDKKVLSCMWSFCLYNHCTAINKPTMSHSSATRLSWVALAAGLLARAEAGPVTYAACQAACAAGAATTTGPAFTAAYAACQSACASSFLLVPEPWGCTIA